MYTARVVRLDVLCDCGPRIVPQRVCSPKATTGHVRAYVINYTALSPAHRPVRGPLRSQHIFPPLCLVFKKRCFPIAPLTLQVLIRAVGASPRPSAPGPAHTELDPAGSQGGRASSRQRAQRSPSRIWPFRWTKPGASSHAPRALARTS
ncbi:hypothetical protein NDU88_007090 [Pleurodeles waltl]|uniref:Uncharacterized protein n=1 Tax=Pleurodeles waltl TaxID=8319 RepID=A0AAV7SRE3_PLEWA|nr:hypothetical protein NDU88_007090 [Pleurodeles waltl]